MEQRPCPHPHPPPNWVSARVVLVLLAVGVLLLVAGSAVWPLP